MNKHWITKISIFLLVILLAISTGLNIFLYQQGREYYLDLNGTRLDPLGINSYFLDEVQYPHDKSVVVFYGDSRAAGWITPQISGMTFVNHGIGAQTTSQVLGRFAYHVLPLKADVIIIQVGINDLKTIPIFPERKTTIIADCKTNIRRIVELSIQNGIHVILTTIFPPGQLPIERRPFWSDDVAIAIDDVNGFIKTLESDQVTIFDTTAILANNDGITDPKYSKDFLHLNEKGYEALNGELAQLLNR